MESIAIAILILCIPLAVLFGWFTHERRINGLTEYLGYSTIVHTGEIYTANCPFVIISKNQSHAELSREVEAEFTEATLDTAYFAVVRIPLPKRKEK